MCLLAASLERASCLRTNMRYRSTSLVSCTRLNGRVYSQYIESERTKYLKCVSKLDYTDSLHDWEGYELRGHSEV